MIITPKKHAVTANDIAARLNVSLSTVNKALTGKSGVSEKCRERVVAAAREMGYTVNHAAQALSRRKFAGEMAADLFDLALPAGGTAAVFTGTKDIKARVDKVRAFTSRISARQHGIVAIYETQDDPRIAEICAERLFQEYPDVRGIYVSTATAQPILRRVEELDPATRPLVVTTDVCRELCEAMRRGVVAATVFQNQVLTGRMAARMAYDYLIESASYHGDKWKLHKDYMHGTITFGYGVEDSATALMRMSGGALATVQCNFNIPDEAAMWRLEFFGTRGRLAGDGVIGQTDGGSVDAMFLDDVGGYDARQNREARAAGARFEVELGNTYAREVESFCLSLLNETPLEVPAEEAVAAQRVIKAAYASNNSLRLIALS